MHLSERKAEDEIFVCSKDEFLPDNHSIKREYQFLLPKRLHTALNVYGIVIRRTEQKTSTEKKSFRSRFIKNTKLVFAHLVIITLAPLLYFILADHVTFAVSGGLDFLCYLAGVNIFFYRKELIIECLVELSKIQMISERNEAKSPKNVAFLLSISFIYASIYLIYGFTMRIYDLRAFADYFEYSCKILYIILYFVYCFYVCMGIPVQITLFVQLASMISNRLLLIEQTLKQDIKRIYFSKTIKEQRLIFIKLQKIASSVDIVFNELLLLWFVKIIFRGCLSAVDVLTIAWTLETLPTQVLVTLDILFDLSQLLILCAYGGKICENKDKILESLIYFASKFSSDNQGCIQEHHFFVSLVGHSQFCLTVGNIFRLDKSTALNILGILASYSILIHQFSSKQ